jgi:hypothetical protein
MTSKTPHIVIPAKAGIALQQRSWSSHFSSSTTKPVTPPAFRNSNCDPCLRRDDEQNSHIVIPAKAGIALQQRSWSSHFGPSTTKPAIPPAFRNSNCDPCLRRDDEQNPHIVIPAKAGIALQQRSWSSHFGSPTTKPAIPPAFRNSNCDPCLRRDDEQNPHIVIPAKAGIALQQRSWSSHFSSSTTKPSLPPALRNNNCDPCLRRDDEQNPNIVIPAKVGMTNKTGSPDTPYGSAWASRLVNMAECPIPAAEYQQEPPE